MLVVDVVRVRVGVHEWLVPMPVGMRDLGQLFGRVLVQMVLVMFMLVCVSQVRMLVPMLVPIGRQQERAGRHRGQRDDSRHRHGLVEKHPGEDRGKSRRQRE